MCYLVRRFYLLTTVSARSYSKQALYKLNDSLIEVDEDGTTLLYSQQPPRIPWGPPPTLKEWDEPLDQAETVPLDDLTEFENIEPVLPTPMQTQVSSSCSLCLTSANDRYSHQTPRTLPFPCRPQTWRKYLSCVLQGLLSHPLRIESLTLTRFITLYLWCVFKLTTVTDLPELSSSRIFTLTRLLPTLRSLLLLSTIIPSGFRCLHTTCPRPKRCLTHLGLAIHGSSRCEALHHGHSHLTHVSRRTIPLQASTMMDMQT